MEHSGIRQIMIIICILAKDTNKVPMYFGPFSQGRMKQTQDSFSCVPLLSRSDHLCFLFFSQVVFMTKLLVFDVFQYGASFLFLNKGETCLAISELDWTFG